MSTRSTILSVIGFTATLLTLGNAALGQTARSDPYDLLLRSRSLDEQRTALAAVLRTPQPYIARMRQDLREYPKRLKSNYVAANRAVYIATLVRDTSFALILAGLLPDEDVQDECAYDCPVIFSLTIYASFAGW